MLHCQVLHNVTFTENNAYERLVFEKQDRVKRSCLENIQKILMPLPKQIIKCGNKIKDGDNFMEVSGHMLGGTQDKWTKL